ncbi:MAG: hypothetical protein ACK49R_05810 [Planctomycetota bacterium]|jgi:indole-3-glycerol phosphate synthase/phosphoribosylanthranilate isomerase|nr:indole-3-glycerol-phosphate synthase TrpC [Blastopirellula sp.]
MSTILERIVADKRKALEVWKAEFPLGQLERSVVRSDRDFLGAIAQANPAYIFECKQASPSQGLIRGQFDLAAIARVYASYATCVSVLTEEQHFSGRMEHLREVRGMIGQPVLNKDFFIEPYQVWLGRWFGADAILLMLSVVDDATWRELSGLAAELGMAVLTEVATVEEMQRAERLSAKLIGINNRDLHTLQIDLERTARLAPLAPRDALLISESGYATRADLQRNRRYVQGYLVGSSLMRQPDLDLAVRELILEEEKGTQ